MIGKILGKTVRVVNAPVRAAEDILEEVMGDGRKMREEDRLASKPLDCLADQLEDVDEDDDV